MATDENGGSGTSSQSAPRPKLLDIERGKGLGILLVVYGHLVAIGTLGIQPWYQHSATALYYFHMPFFMYLSGYVFFYTGVHEALSRNFGRFAFKRFDRLMVPFLVFGFIIVLGKGLVGQFLSVDDPVTSIWSGMWNVVSNGQPNPAVSIWYLAVLFVYSLATPLVWSALGGRLGLIFVAALAIHFLPLPQDFYAVRISRYYVFFVLGMLACRHADVFAQSYRRFFFPALALFAAGLYIGNAQPYPLLLCGLASIPVLHHLVRSTLFDKDRFLLWIGQNSMVIYLLNTIVIGVAKGLYVKVLPYEGAWFFVLVAVLMLAGTFVPILFRKTLDNLPFAAPFRKYVQ